MDKNSLITHLCACLVIFEPNLILPNCRITLTRFGWICLNARKKWSNRLKNNINSNCNA